MKNYFFSGNQLFIEGKVIYHIIVETKFLEQKAFVIEWKLCCYDIDDENMLERKEFSKNKKCVTVLQKQIFSNEISVFTKWKMSCSSVGKIKDLEWKVFS